MVSFPMRVKEGETKSWRLVLLELLGWTEVRLQCWDLPGQALERVDGMRDGPSTWCQCSLVSDVDMVRGEGMGGERNLYFGWWIGVWLCSLSSLVFLGIRAKHEHRLSLLFSIDIICVAVAVDWDSSERCHVANSTVST
jgi:hypothetical protein